MKTTINSIFIIPILFLFNSCNNRVSVTDDHKNPTVLVTISGDHFSCTWNSSTGKSTSHVYNNNDTVMRVEDSFQTSPQIFDLGKIATDITIIVVSGDGGGIEKSGVKINLIRGITSEEEIATSAYDVLEKSEETLIDETHPPFKYYNIVKTASSAVPSIIYKMKIKIYPDSYLDLSGFGSDFQNHQTSSPVYRFVVIH